MNKRGAYQRKARNIENVQARHALLVAGLKSPELVSQSVTKMVTGQRVFCTLSLPGSKIEPLSLNTLKSLADEVYSQVADADGQGFQYLDNLRIRLNRLLTNTPRGRSADVKAARQVKRQEILADHLHAVELQNIRRSKAYLDLFGKINTFIKAGAIEDATRLRLYKLLETHHMLYGDLFGPQGTESIGDRAVLFAWPGSGEK